MNAPQEPDRTAVPVWAWVTIGVLTLAVAALITALALVVSAGGPENGPTRLEQTGTPPPRLTTTTTTTSESTSTTSTATSTTTTTTAPSTTTTTATTESTTTAPTTTTTTQSTTTTTSPSTTTTTASTGATTPQGSPGAGFEWAKLGPYSSESACRSDHDAWPAEAEDCFAEDGSYYFWGVRQS